jgi:hypothetical protein
VCTRRDGDADERYARRSARGTDRATGHADDSREVDISAGGHAGVSKSEIVSKPRQEIF